MKLIYEGTDMSPYVNITRCVHRDTVGRADVLEIEMDCAAAWYRWKPQVDDKISLTHEGYDTGTLYLSSVLPESDKFRILAASIPASVHKSQWKSYEKQTLGGIVSQCAAECGMSGALYGVPSYLYEYMLRRNERAAAFIARLGAMEGFVVKAYGGAIRCVGLDYAAGRAAVDKMSITTLQDGARYVRSEALKYKSVTVTSPYGDGTASDGGVSHGAQYTADDLPATDGGQSARWAQGILRMHNRMAETLTVESTFRPALTALAGVTVDGGTDADGLWLCEDVTHDFVNNRTAAKMLRG